MFLICLILNDYTDYVKQQIGVIYLISIIF